MGIFPRSSTPLVGARSIGFCVATEKPHRSDVLISARFHATTTTLLSNALPPMALTSSRPTKATVAKNWSNPFFSSWVLAVASRSS